MTEKETAKQWYEIPELKGSKLGSLAVDLSEALKEKKDAEKRVEAIRSLISPLMSATSEPVAASDLEMTWVRPEKGEEWLDKTALLLAGVTPEQIVLGTKMKPPKKPHLRVSVISKGAEPISEGPRVGEGAGLGLPMEERS